MKDIANPTEGFEEEVIERPNSCAIRMPWDLYKILNWQSNDGLEWTYIDKDRVLLRRVPAEHGEEGEPIPEGTFTPVEPTAAPTPKDKQEVITEEDLKDQVKTQDDYKKEASKSPTPEMTQEEIDAMIANVPVERGHGPFDDSIPDKVNPIDLSIDPNLYQLPVDHMTAEGEDLPTDDEVRETKKKLIEKYSTTVIDEDGNEKQVLRYEPEGGFKKGTPEYEFERKRVKKEGIPPQPEDGGPDADSKESE